MTSHGYVSELGACYFTLNTSKEVLRNSHNAYYSLLKYPEQLYLLNMYVPVYGY